MAKDRHNEITDEWRTQAYETAMAMKTSRSDLSSASPGSPHKVAKVNKA
jgi:hypothetical protein